MGGLPLTFYLARNRKYKPGSLAMWKIFIDVSNEELLKQFKDKRSLDKSFAFGAGKTSHLLWSLRKIKFCSIKLYFANNPDRFKQLAERRAKFRSFLIGSLSQSNYFGTGPPKGFVPLPDAEIGGCARNDSLIAPAIN